MELPPDLPAVHCDADRLVQVLINLLSNAVKFTPTGSVCCRAYTRDDQMIVEVSDTGIGIPERDKPFIFERFHQVGETLTDKPKGTGLGLSICKQIIEYHNGRIGFESTEGQGSTFYFSLPL